MGADPEIVGTNDPVKSAVVQGQTGVLSKLVEKGA